jgi:copper chaperone
VKTGEELTMATATLKVTGMTCGHCVKAVTEALQSQNGVSRAEVDLTAGRAQVEYDESRVTPRELANVVTEEGYAAEETA